MESCEVQEEQSFCDVDVGLVPSYGFVDDPLQNVILAEDSLSATT